MSDRVLLTSGPRRSEVGDNSTIPTVTTEHQDDDSSTSTELHKRFQHLRRITRKQSQPFMRTHPGTERFGDLYSEFQDFYTRDQLRSLEKCFLSADHDQDGHLNPFELRYWMEKHNSPISNVNLKHVMKAADLDGDGKLSFREFILLCKQIELKSIDGGGSGGTIFECLGEDTSPDLDYPNMRPKTPGSFSELKAEVHGNVRYFEDRIANELSGPKPHGDEGYLERIREINQNPDFNLLEFFKDLRHPSKETKEVCNEEVIETPQIQHRHVTTASITLENNLEPEVDHEGTESPPHWNYVNDEFDDPMKVIVAIRPSSSHKFEPGYEETNYRDSLDFSNQEEAKPLVGVDLVTPDLGTQDIDVDVEATGEVIDNLTDVEVEAEAERVRRRSQNIQTSYERFYGSQSSMTKFIVPDLQEDFENLELNSPKNSSNTNL